ncbi:MAG: hypothetical protein JHC87_08545 [Thermoleophilaceae bacterium]|nr:hypothetical protein [Thermoleophilaceae bacterium]
MLPVAFFGVDNNGFGVAVNLLVIFLIATWLALVYWAYSDAKRRLDDSVLVAAAGFAALVFPFAGALVYAIVRPPETMDDRYERELDIRAAELRVRMLEKGLKSGPEGAAYMSSVAGELSGEPTTRRAASSRSASAPSKAPPVKRPQSGLGGDTAAAQRRAERPGEQPSATRPSQAPRPAQDDPRQQPTA